MTPYNRREQLRSLGVGQLFLYGSAARNEAREDSDVDLLVEPSNQRFSIFDLMRVRDLCRTTLGTAADIHDAIVRHVQGTVTEVIRR